jgi:hypothetical protein
MVPVSAPLRAAAELAAVLEVDLHRPFVDDEALLALAEPPFAHELGLPSHEWQPVEAGRRRLAPCGGRRVASATRGGALSLLPG